MAWLANAILTIVSQAVAFFGLQMSKRVLFVTAALSTMMSLTVAFTVAVKLAIEGISATLPTWASSGAAMFLPENIPSCFGALMSAKLAAWIYRYYIGAVRVAAGAIV